MAGWEHICLCPDAVGGWGGTFVLVPFDSNELRMLTVSGYLVWSTFVLVLFDSNELRMLTVSGCLVWSTFVWVPFDSNELRILLVGAWFGARLSRSRLTAVS